LRAPLFTKKEKQMKDLFSVKGKVALVTGGSRGIGEMIANGYIQNGAKVYISSRKKAVCDELAKELSKHGECISLPFDLGTMEGVEGLANAMKEREEKLDILVNNAGAAWASPIDEFPEQGWDKVMDLNVKSVFFLTQKLLPLLRKAASPESPARVINVASVNGMSPPHIETYSYSASKSGCIMLTRHLAWKLVSESILVNCIAPGPFPTQMLGPLIQSMGDEILESTPMHRVGTPEDIAGVALFLSSRASNYTTGVTIPCDGGIAML